MSRRREPPWWAAPLLWRWSLSLAALAVALLGASVSAAPSKPTAGEGAQPDDDGFTAARDCLERLAAADDPGLIGPIFTTACLPAIPDEGCRAAFAALATTSGPAALEAINAACERAVSPAVIKRFGAFWDDPEVDALARAGRFEAALSAMIERMKPARPGELVTLVGLMLIRPIEVKMEPLPRLPDAPPKAARLIIDVEPGGRVRLALEGGPLPCGRQPVCPDDDALEAAVRAFAERHRASDPSVMLRVEPSVQYSRVVKLIERVRDHIPRFVLSTGSEPPPEPQPKLPPPDLPRSEPQPTVVPAAPRP